MTKKIQVNLYGMDGEGESVKEAKIDAGKKIESVLKGSYIPVMVEKNGNQIIVYRDVNGWNHMINHGGERVGYSLTIGFTDFDDAVKHAFYHVEQMAWDFNSDDTFTLLNDYPNMKRELQDWAKWQRIYKAWKDLGNSDSYCRDMANKNIFPL